MQRNYADCSKKPRQNALLTTAAARVDRSISIVELWSIQREVAFVVDVDDPVSRILVRLQTTGSSPRRLRFFHNQWDWELAYEVRSNKRARCSRAHRESRIRANRPGERKRRDVEHNLACLRRTATDCKLEQTPSNVLSGNVVVTGNQSANVATKPPLQPPSSQTYPFGRCAIG